MHRCRPVLYIPVMPYVLEAILQLAITAFGFYCVGYGVGIFKKHPAKVLGEMIHATLRGSWWLTKIVCITTFELASGLATGLIKGAPSNGRDTTDNRKHYLTGFDRFKLLNQWKDGLVLDGKRAISLQDSFRHAAVFSPTGGGKTTTVILPAVLNLKPDRSVVINDPSGEIHTKASGWLLKQGFDVRVIDVSRVDQSLSFNPLFRTNSHTEIGQVADSLVHHAFADSRSDPFWNLKARELLAVLIRCLKKAEPEYCNLHNLRHLLNSFGHDGSPLNAWIAKHVPDEATFTEWKGFIAQSPKVMQNIISTASAALEKVADPSIAHLTATETLHFEDIRKRPTAIFTIVPEHQTRYWAFLTDTLLQQVFSFCMEPKRSDEPYLPVFFLLDEFGHARIPGFSTATVTMRKRDCAICILLQEPSMLEKTYGKADAATILGGGMVSKVFMSGLSLETCERLSRIIGKGDDNRPILSASAIRTLPDRTALLIHGNKKPVVLQMTPYFKNPKLLRRTRLPPAPLPENKTSTELSYISLGDVSKKSRTKVERKRPQREDNKAALRTPTEAPEAPEPTGSSDQPLSESSQVSPRPTREPISEPAWAGEILKESRRARLEMEGLRDVLGLHTVTRQEAAAILGVSPRTLQRWEEKGLIQRLDVSARGVHFDYESVVKLKQERS